MVIGGEITLTRGGKAETSVSETAAPLPPAKFTPSMSVRKRRERSEALSGTGTVMEATKARLEAVAYLPVPMVRIHFPPALSHVRTCLREPAGTGAEGDPRSGSAARPNRCGFIPPASPPCGNPPTTFEYRRENGLIRRKSVNQSWE